MPSTRSDEYCATFIRHIIHSEERVHVVVFCFIQIWTNGCVMKAWHASTCRYWFCAWTAQLQNITKSKFQMESVKNTNNVWSLPGGNMSSFLTTLQGYSSSLYIVIIRTKKVTVKCCTSLHFCHSTNIMHHTTHTCMLRIYNTLSNQNSLVWQK